MLRRGIVFIDLATAQVVGLAVILSSLWLAEPLWIEHQAIAFGAGLAVAVFFRWIERVTPDEQEAVIGSCFIVASSVALLALAGHPTGGEMLRHVLSGQLLFVTWVDIAAFLPIYGIYVLLWLCAPRLRTGTGFFLLFALVITASMQLVGVYVVFASLILPALAARRGGGLQSRPCACKRCRRGHYRDPAGRSVGPAGGPVPCGLPCGVSRGYAAGLSREPRHALMRVANHGVLHVPWILYPPGSGCQARAVAGGYRPCSLMRSVTWARSPNGLQTFGRDRLHRHSCPD